MSWVLQSEEEIRPAHGCERRAGRLLVTDFVGGVRVS